MRDCRFRESVEVIICKFPSSLLLTASLIDCCEVEGIFAQARMSLRDFSFLREIIGGWLKICLSLGCC